MARLNITAAQIALRTRAETLVVCTTGSTTLGQSADGFTRLTGSFLTDGFRAGMEVTPSGFVSTTRVVLTDVTALLAKTRTALSVVSEASGRTLSVGLPLTRHYENRDTTIATDVQPFIEEEYVPRPPDTRTMPAQGASRSDFGEWVVRWYGLQGVDVPGNRTCVDAFLDLFTPGTQLTAGSHILTVQGTRPGDPSPFASQFLRSGNHMVSTIRIPVWAQTTNVIAA